MSDTLLVTGSSGFIGSEVVEYFTRNGWRVHRVDNNQRADFFGPAGDTRCNRKRLLERNPTFTHHELDVRDRDRVARLVADFSTL
jgi:CDP-paratose 2-epimerase